MKRILSCLLLAIWEPINEAKWPEGEKQGFKEVESAPHERAHQAHYRHLKPCHLSCPRRVTAHTPLSGSLVLTRILKNWIVQRYSSKFLGPIMNLKLLHKFRSSSALMKIWRRTWHWQRSRLLANKQLSSLFLCVNVSPNFIYVK